MRSDANIAGPMTDPVPGPRTESAGEDVSRETPPPMDDTPIGRAAQLAVEALGRAGEGLPRPEQTRVMVVANQKGGVGKTTTTVNLAASLALHGARVLVVDLDPQGNASTALGIDHHAEVPSIYDVLVESRPLSEVVQPVPDVEGLFCAPATIDLAGAEIELVSLVARESRLQRAIQAYEQPLDYILIDCPPSLGLLTVNALVAGAEVLIPIQCEYYALEGLGQLLRNVDLVRGHLNPDAACVDHPAHHVRRPDPAGLPGGGRGAQPLRQGGAADEHPALGAYLRGAELWADGADLRSGIERCPCPILRRPERSRCGGSGCSTTRSTPISGSQNSQQSMVGGDPVSERRRGLGRGLGALIPAAPTGEAGASRVECAHPRSPAAVPVLTAERGVAAAKVATLRRPVSRETSRAVAERCGGTARPRPCGAHFAELPLDSITPNPRQPREVFDEDALAELVTSIKEVGLLQPVVVRQVGPDRYELIMGERRWRACREAGLEAIPAIVRATDDEKLLLDALLENLHRAQLNPLEEAAAYDQLLKDFNCTHDQLADRIGRSRPQVSNTLRLLRLSPPVQRRVAAGVLSAGHARALLSVEDSEEQDRLAHRIVAEGLSVRAVEEIVTLMGSQPAEHVQAEGPAGRRPAVAGADRPGVPALGPLRDAGEGRPGPEEGQDRRRVRLDGGSGADPRHPRSGRGAGPGEGPAGGRLGGRRRPEARWTGARPSTVRAGRVRCIPEHGPLFAFRRYRCNRCRGYDAFWYGASTW